MLLVLHGGAAAQEAPAPRPEPAAAVQDAPPPHGGALRVATGAVAPFVLERGGALSGFSVELWTAVAQRIGARTRWVDAGPRSDEAQVELVAAGGADLAVSAIPVTAARERRLDFSLPYFDGGLQVLVPADGAAALLDTLGDALSPALARTVLAGLAVLLALGHVLWLVERRGADPRARRGYLRGLGDGVWGAMLVIATGEHGDRETPSVVKRLTVACMWLLGVVLVAQFTASVTSSLTVRQLRSAVGGPSDLGGRALGSVEGSAAAAYLRARGLGFAHVPSPERGIRMLLDGEVDAIVFEAPTVQYWAAHLGGGRVRVAGPVFHPEKYAIALPPGSPLRKPVNAALLELMDDGTYEEIRRRWFGGAG